MRKSYYLLLIAFLLFIFACSKQDKYTDIDDSDLKMEDLAVSDDFTWQTTYDIKVKLPEGMSPEGQTIYIVDDQQLYYKGPATREIYPVTVPSDIDTNKVKIKTYNPFNPDTQSSKAPDSDGDGVKDNKDDFPNDGNRAYKNFYPVSNMGTLAYEDLWPAKGDYDFNDMVIDYRFQANTNANDQVIEVFATFVLRAIGAGYHNAFAFEFPYVKSNEVIDVSGYSVNSPVFNISSNGTEANQSNLNVVVFDDAYEILPSPGGGTGVNVDHSMAAVQSQTKTIDMEFFRNGQFASGGSITTWDLSLSSFNPYIIANVSNDGRGREIHLPGKYPTDLADTSYFNTVDDDTDEWVYSGWKSSKMFWMKTYETANNYPWALNFYDNFDYMIETKSIMQGYLKFPDWAQNGSNPNWYKINNSAFRNSQNIY